MHPTNPKKIVLRFSVLIFFFFFIQQIAAQVPVINSFTPTSGAVNTPVTINGSNFSTVSADNIVYFGAVKAPVITATATSLSVTVPAGALYQPISVTVNNLTAYSPKWFSTTGIGAVLSATSFNPSVSFSTPQGPSTIAASDMDGDGKADLLSTNESNNGVLSIFRNTGSSGNIAFATRIDLTNNTWSYGIRLATADFDGDGKTDIIVANPNGGKIFVYKNTSTPGIISLATPTEITTSTSPKEIAVADFNADGKPDIAITGGNSFQVFRNTSTGTTVSFTSAYTLSEGDYYLDIVAADFNADGKPDIALVDYFVNRLTVYKNNSTAGTITFDFKVNFVTGTGPAALAAGDVDENGIIDVAVINANANTVSIFKNSSSTGGLIFLEPKVDIATNSSPNSVAFGNVDGDSKPDLLVGTSQSKISVYQNNTSGSPLSFAAKLDYTTIGISNSLIACDLDNDGKTDISATQGNTAGIAVIRNRQKEPVITGFTPKGGQPGTNVLITGSNFTGATSVAIGNVPATSFNILNDSTIAAVAGNGTSGSIAVTNTYGTGSFTGFVFGPPPVITSFSPVSAKSGISVQIKGAGFTGATAVSFGGTPAQSFFFISDTFVVATVSTGSSGDVSVTATTGTGVLPGFTFLPPPVVTSFTPTSSLSGTAIDIKGSNFTGATAVSFGETPASSFTVLSDTSLTAVVGNGSTGSVAVANQNGTSYLAGFTYLGPNVSTFSPAIGGPGTVVTISGTNFTGATAVSFGGIPAASFTVVSSSTITAVTGNGATGDVSVTTSAGTGTKSGFTAPPYIASISPAFAPAGTSVTITGNSFYPLYTVANSVYFGTVKAPVTAAGSTALTVTVPAGAFFAPVSVTTNSLTGYSSRAFITTFTGGPLVPASFALKQLVASSLNSTDNNISIGDINNDRKPDIIVPRLAGIAVFKNSSTAGGAAFDTALNFPTGTSGYTSSASAVADLNMDGGLDVVTAGSVQNSITIFRNQNFSTSVNFFTGSNFTVGNGPNSLAVGDLDKDGKPEIVVSNYNSKTISVLRNTSMFSNISFATKIDFPTVASPRVVFLEDFDQDGRLDIVLLNHDSAYFSVFRNTSTGNGTIAFAARNDVATAAFPVSMAVADIDGDNRTDIVVNNSGSFSVFRNNSTTSSIGFNPKTDFTTFNGVGGVTINDMDGDGKPDVIINNFGNGVANIFKNNSTAGTLSFNAPVIYPVLENAAYSYTGDMDGDGKTDIISASSSGIYLVRNKFNEAPVVTSFSPQTAKVGDTILIKGARFTGATSVNFGNTSFNSFTVLSDNSIAAIVGAGSGGAVSVTTPYGTSSFGNLSILTPPIIAGFTPLSATVGSAVTVTGSGFSPVAADNIVFFGTAKAVVSAATASSLTVLVPPGVSHQHISVTVNGLSAWSSRFFNTTFPGAGPAFASYYFDTSNNTTLPGISGIRAMSAGDIDMDGKPDLAMTIYDGSSLRTSVIKNTGNGTNISFGSRIVLPESGGGTIIFTDMSGDGQPDLVVGNYSGIYLANVHKNNSTPGNLAFSTDFSLYLPFTTNTKMRIADIDQDGRPDIILKAIYDSRVMVVRNNSANGVSSYSLPITVGEVSSGSFNDNDAELLVEDFSGDGRPDIAMLLNNRLAVLKNTGVAGNISFAPESSFYSVYSSKNGVASDFDGDGRIDIAAFYTQPNVLLVSRNIGTNGNIAFANPVSIPLASTPYRIASGDLDGDGKPDLCVNNIETTNLFSIFKNTSPADTITFAPATNLDGNFAGPLLISDVDSDGKPDILLANGFNNRIRIFRNAIGEPIPILLCPSVSSASVSSNITGASYQWQVNTGSGFVDIGDNANYTGTGTATLQLNNIPSSWYGYQYRCMAGVVSSNISIIQFSNKWSGAVSSVWENPANWNCSAMPDVNTDVVINSGTVIINSNVTVRSLKVKPGATVRVAGGNILTVLP